MDWNRLKNDTPQEGGNRAKLGPGKHLVKVARVTSRKKDGQLITDKNGNPQLAVTLSNHEGEISYFAPTRGTLVWKLERLITVVCTDKDFDNLSKRRVSLDDFMREDVHNEFLVGRMLLAQGKVRGDFIDWSLFKAPLPSKFNPPDATDAHVEDIPF